MHANCTYPDYLASSADIHGATVTVVGVSVAAAFLAVEASAVAAVAYAGQCLIHPYQFYFPCSGG